MTGLICPKCGKNSDEIRFIEAFCINCYPANIKCPRKLEIEQCKACKKMRIKGEWVPYSKHAVKDHVIGKCRGEFTGGDYDLEEQTAEFTIAEGATVKRTVGLDIITTMCRNCSRISGGYFQGIIQLRGPEKKVEKYAEMLIRKLSRKTYITKEEERDGGIDLYVGSSKMVIELLSEMNVKALITRKLVGREEGKRLYRTTFLIRV